MQPDDNIRQYPRFLVTLFLLVMVSGCASVRNWPQFHADGPSQGSLFEATDFALRPAWEFEVGSVDFGKPVSSPVVGPDRTIYVGNLNGDIIAVSPAGTQNWRATTPFRIFSSPAVADDGTIYAVGTSFFPDAKFPDNKFRSTLITISPDGTVLDLSLLPDQGFTAGSPKVWSSGKENYVFLHANTRLRDLNSRANALFVFDRDGDLVARVDLGCPLPVTGGPSILDLLKDLLDLITVEFDTSGLPPDPEDYGWVDPTVAVAERDDLVGAGNAFVVAADQGCSNISAFRWDPPRLERLWFVDEDDKFVASSSPALLNGAALLVIGREDGKVIAYDPADGDKLWTHDARERVLGTPASLVRHIYVASARRIQALEPATGEVFRQRAILGFTVSSPVLSANRVYVSTSLEFQTFNLDLNVVSHDTQGGLGREGSPAIAGDGSVYTLVRRNGRLLLRAYPAR